jgi:enterochelin esterase-like enzyme
LDKVRPNPEWPAGRVIRLSHKSAVLEDNPWGDPVERTLCVYLPAAYEESGLAYPAVWDLAAFTNTGPGHLNWRHRGENLVQRLDRLIGSGEMPPVVVPMPDCFTSLGGNQYLNSPAVGRYADYLLEELIPLLARHVNVIDSERGRAAFGKSSGGYGALALSMLYPGVWGAVASHSGDMGFEWVYRPGFPVACRVLERFSGDINGFLKSFWSRRKVGGDDYSTLMTIAMAATYDPDPAEPSRVRLPFELGTCTLIEERWARWLAFDPLHLVERHAEGLRRLAALHIDVGNRDEYHIQFGTRAFSARLDERGIDHHFEEFDGTHRDLDWRLDSSLPRLAAALTG